MWPFLKKHQAPPVEPDQLVMPTSKRRPLRFDQLLDGIGDFTDLGTHDAVLKFWLPEPARAALEDLASRQGDSMSEMLRQCLAKHVYGIYAFQLMNDRHPGLFKLGIIRPTESTMDSAEMPAFLRKASNPGSEPGPDRRKRIDTYWVPELGKNVVSMKLWLPGRLRNDLKVLADHAQIKLSQYVREIVISRLLGHGALPKRPEMLEAQPLHNAELWESGRRVPMHQVERDEYCKHDEGEVRTEWVQEPTA